MRARSRSLFAASLTVAMVAVGLIVGVSPASAAARPAPPGPTGYVWGIKTADMPVTVGTFPADGNCAGKGGWIQDPYYSFQGYKGAPDPSAYAAITRRACEPFMYQTAPGAAKQLIFDLQYTVLANNKPGLLSTENNVVNGAISAPHIYCSNKEWSQPSDISVFTSWFSSSSRSGDRTTTSKSGDDYVGPFALSGVGGIVCPYLVSFDVMIFSWASGHTTDADAIKHQIAWGADQSYTPRLYAPYDPVKQLCGDYGLGASTDCAYVVPGVDGSDASVVCANPPIPNGEFLDTSWIGPAIAFYARCLFVPVNGFDRLGWINSSWASGPGSQLGVDVLAVGAAFNISESCGPIVPTLAEGPLQGFSLTTCAWTWAPAMKVYLGWAVVVMFGIWAFGFLIDSINGVVNRKVVSPLADKDGGS